jgi:hypothetical protein
MIGAQANRSKVNSQNGLDFNPITKMTLTQVHSPNGWKLESIADSLELIHV